jgi:hydrogenase-4 component E
MAYEFEILLSIGVVIFTIIILINNLLKNQLYWFIAQTILLGLVALDIGITQSLNGSLSILEGTEFIAIAIITIVVKGIIIPVAIFKVIKKSKLDESADEQPKAFTVSISRTIFIAAILVILSYIIVQPVLLAEPLIFMDITPLLLPVSFAIVLLGLYLAGTSKKIHSQLIALLVMENGIYFASISTVFEIPAMIDIGILFDIFAAVTILVIFLIAIHRNFNTVQVNKLNELKE